MIIAVMIAAALFTFAGLWSPWFFLIAIVILGAFAIWLDADREAYIDVNRKINARQQANLRNEVQYRATDVANLQTLRREDRQCYIRERLNLMARIDALDRSVNDRASERNRAEEQARIWESTAKELAHAYDKVKKELVEAYAFIDTMGRNAVQNDGIVAEHARAILNTVLPLPPGYGEVPQAEVRCSVTHEWSPDEAPRERHDSPLAPENAGTEQPALQFPEASNEPDRQLRPAS